MNLIIGWIKRFTDNPKTTAGGVVAGTGATAALVEILNQAGCNFSNVQWMMIVGIAFGIPALIGGMATDSGKAAPVPELPKP